VKLRYYQKFHGARTVFGCCVGSMRVKLTRPANVRCPDGARSEFPHIGRAPDGHRTIYLNFRSSDFKRREFLKIFIQTADARPGTGRYVLKSNCQRSRSDMQFQVHIATTNIHVYRFLIILLEDMDKNAPEKLRMIKMQQTSAILQVIKRNDLFG